MTSPATRAASAPSAANLAGSERNRMRKHSQTRSTPKWIRLPISALILLISAVSFSRLIAGKCGDGLPRFDFVMGSVWISCPPAGWRKNDRDYKWKFRVFEYSGDWHQDWWIVRDPGYVSVPLWMPLLA